MDRVDGTQLPGERWNSVEVVKTLQYYDGPRLRLLRSRTGQHFLAWWSDSDAATDRWVCLPISQGRLLRVLSGDLPSREAIEEPEDGYIYVVDYASGDGGVISVVETTSINVDPEALPVADARLALPAIQEVYGIQANERGHMVIARIEPPAVGSKFVPAKTLSVYIGAFQRLVDSIGQAVSGKPTARGAVPAEILSQTKLNAVAAQPGSFSVFLQSEQSDDLRGDSTVRKSLETLFALLRTKNRVGELTQQLAKLGGRVTKNYDDLLGVISSSTRLTATGWTDYLRSRYQHVEVSQTEADEIRVIIEKVSSEVSNARIKPQVSSAAGSGVLRVRGILLGANVRTMRFELEDDETGERLSGVLDENAKPAMVDIGLGSHCETVLEPRREVSAETGDERTTYLLRQIVKITG